MEAHGAARAMVSRGQFDAEPALLALSGAAAKEVIGNAKLGILSCADLARDGAENHLITKIFP